MNKLSLPNELTNDGYFCAYTLRYFINDYIISNNVTSNDDIKVKYEENMNLALLMINRAISQGCYHFKYNKNETIFLKACKELYFEIIKHQQKWNPARPDCEYFKVQNEIALGEKNKSFNYSEDPNIDKDLYNKMKENYAKLKTGNVFNTIKQQMYMPLKNQGFSDSQIDELVNISINTPHLTESKIKEMNSINNSEIMEEDERVNVDSFLEELGLQ